MFDKSSKKRAAQEAGWGDSSQGPEDVPARSSEWGTGWIDYSQHGGWSSNAAPPQPWEGGGSSSSSYYQQDSGGSSYSRPDNQVPRSGRKGAGKGKSKDPAQRDTNDPYAHSAWYWLLIGILPLLLGATLSRCFASGMEMETTPLRLPPKHRGLEHKGEEEALLGHGG